MPNRETVRALVSAFNVHNYARNTVKTNFKLQSEGKKGYIVVSFDKGMSRYQCSRYLDSIKRKIVGEFYGIEEGDTDEVVLNTANLIFNIESFPFNTSKGKWSQDEQGRIEFLAPIDKGVIFNLKSHLAFSLKKDVQEDMLTYINSQPFDKKKYLWCGEFDNKGLRKQFEREFLSRMKARYENVPKKPLEVKGNSVYIKNVFDDARFIDSVTRCIAWLKGMGLQADSKVRNDVKAFKDLIIEFINQSTELTVAGFIRNFPLNEKIAKILIPVVLDNGEPRVLASEEALKLNCTFNKYSYYAVFIDLYSRAQAELPINGDVGIYGIDFSNPYISHCVITKIIESSVINKDHELSIDPELRFRALSRSPSTELSDMELESPTRSQGGVKDSPRQGSEKEEGPRLLNYVNSVRTSDRPLTDLSYATTSCGVPGISRDLSAGEGTLTGASIGDSYFLPSTLTSFPRVITPPVPYGIPTRPTVLTTRHDPMSPNHEFFARSSCFEDMNILSMKSEEHDKSEQGACSQVGVRALEGAQADDESMPIEIRGEQVSYRSSGPYIRGGKRMQSVLQRLQLSSSKSSSFRPSSISCPTAWDDSISLNFGVSEDSPKDTENICNEEHKEQKVIDKSDQKSSDECSEAKSQDSKSPEKKHGGGLRCSERKPDDRTFLEKISSHFRRNNKGRNSVCSISSSLSAPETPVTEKPPVSTRSPSLPIEIVKSRSLKVTPVTEVYTENKPTELNDSITELPSQGTVGKLNMPGGRSSKISVDSGLGSLERGRSPPLTEEFSDPSQQNLSIGVKLGNMLSELLNSAQNLLKNPASSTHRGVSGGPKRQASLTSSQRQELRKVLSPEMRKKLDANFFPPGYEKLLHLLYVDSEGLCSLLSSPEAKEQVCSVLPPEEKEQVQSGSPEEIVRLLHKFFSNQKISDNCLLSSKIDSPKIKKLLQEEIFV